jgi:hypothetical protein
MTDALQRQYYRDLRCLFDEVGASRLLVALRKTRLGRREAV